MDESAVTRSGQFNTTVIPLISFETFITLVSEQLQEANARLEAELAEMELAPVQRKIEARSSDDSFTGLVRTLYFADTFLSDSELY